MNDLHATIGQSCQWEKEVRKVIEVVIQVKVISELREVLKEVKELRKNNPYAKFRIEVEW